MIYSYSVLRYVPNSSRMEFVNLGIIAGSDDASDWAMEWVPKSTLANRLGDKASIGAAFRYLSDLSNDIDAYRDALGLNQALDPPLTIGDLRSWSGENRGVVQFSEPMSVVAETAKEAIELLFGSLVESPSTRDNRPGKEKAKSKLMDAYDRAQVLRQYVQKRPKLVSGCNSFNLDYAVANGVVVQLVQTVSFQIRDEAKLVNELQSWAWSLRRLRDSGGELHFRDRRVDVKADVDASLVFVPRIDGENEDAWGVAEEAAKQLRVHSVTADDADSVATAARQLLPS